MCCQSIDLLFLEWICGKMHPFLVSRRYSKGLGFGVPDLGFRVQGFRVGSAFYPSGTSTGEKERECYTSDLEARAVRSGSWIEQQIRVWSRRDARPCQCRHLGRQAVWSRLLSRPSGPGGRLGRLVEARRSSREARECRGPGATRACRCCRLRCAMAARGQRGAATDDPRWLACRCGCLSPVLPPFLVPFPRLYYLLNAPFCSQLVELPRKRVRRA